MKSLWKVKDERWILLLLLLLFLLLASGNGFIILDSTYFLCPGVVILVNHQGRKIKLGTTDP